LIEEPDRMFVLKLAIAWGQKIEYVESLDSDTLLQFKALNIISPFTHDVASNERAMIASMLYNQNASKKSQMRSPTDLFPYISTNTDFLEPELYIKARGILRSFDASSPMYDSQINSFFSDITDTIEIELKRPDCDEYLIRKLRGLQHKGN
jgi:hypothetical protein